MPKHEHILIILASRNIASALPSFRFNNVYLKMGRFCSREPSNYRNHGMQLVVELQVDEGEIRIPAGINV